MTDEAVLETVRRYRAIACLCRQAAAFRPLQKSSLLQQAEDWERLARSELESCFEHLENEEEADVPAELQVVAQWWLPRREGLFAGLPA
jgi:hypothetical protein